MVNDEMSRLEIGLESCDAGDVAELVLDLVLAVLVAKQV
jgi:hypothetical protein